MSAARTPQQARLEVLLKELRLPTMRRVYMKTARDVAHQGGDYESYLLCLVEQEVAERRQRRIDRRLKEAKFPQMKLLSDLDVDAEPMPPHAQLMQLARCDYVEASENILAIGNSGTGKSHLAIGLGIKACKKSFRVRYWTAARLAAELESAQEEHQLHRYLQRFAKLDLVIIDELGYLPLSKRAAELLFQAISERHERRSVIVTSNLPFEEWTEVFHSERLTAALLDRLTHRAHILPMNGPSYRLRSTLTARFSPTITQQEVDGDD